MEFNWVTESGSGSVSKGPQKETGKTEKKNHVLNLDILLEGLEVSPAIWI
jgi:hypothetical protein